jgi:hypothetical protein
VHPENVAVAGETFSEFFVTVQGYFITKYSYREALKLFKSLPSPYIIKGIG